MGAVLRQTWSESQRTVLMGYLRLRFSMFADTARVTNVRIIIIILLSQQMSDAIKHITDDIFFLSGRQRIGAHALCVQHSPTAAALSTSFLLNHAPTA